MNRSREHQTRSPATTAGTSVAPPPLETFEMMDTPSHGVYSVPYTRPGVPGVARMESYVDYHNNSSVPDDETVDLEADSQGRDAVPPKRTNTLPLPSEATLPDQSVDPALQHLTDHHAPVVKGNEPSIAGSISTERHDSTIIDKTLAHENVNEPGVSEPVSPGVEGLDEKMTTTKPTCSLNLVCYRSGSQGCLRRQIQTIYSARFKDAEAFQAAVEAHPEYISDDEQLFRTLNKEYDHMCSFWKRYFSLKTLRSFRILQYNYPTRPSIAPFDDFALQEILYAFQHPSEVEPGTAWIAWVFRLRQADRRHALEFVEGWSGPRIIVAGTISILLSTVVGIAWSVRTGDVQTAFTVAGFILTTGTVMLALLAVVSGLDSSKAL